MKHTASHPPAKPLRPRATASIVRSDAIDRVTGYIIGETDTHYYVHREPSPGNTEVKEWFCKNCARVFTVPVAPAP